MKDNRPKNLNLFTIRLPAPAIISILHRISGLILFLCIPLVLWLFHLSLASQQDFEKLQYFFSLTGTKIFILLCSAAFIYHLVAGIRHLLMDIHIGENLESGRLSAWLTLIISLILVGMAGVWLW